MSTVPRREAGLPALNTDPHPGPLPKRHDPFRVMDQEGEGGLAASPMRGGGEGSDRAHRPAWGGKDPNDTMAHPPV